MIIEINPIAFYIPIPFFGWWPIYWYGISWLVAILSINYFAKLGAPSNGIINKKIIDDFIFYGVLGAIIGGRIGYMIFYGFENLIRDPLSLFKVWEGGLSFHGGLIGVLVSFLFFSETRKISFFRLSDHMAIYLPLGLGSVRVGNFLGGELLGRPTDIPWGVIYSNDPSGLVRHPSQIYQAFFEGVVMFFILLWIARKKPPKMLLSGIFLILYGIFRSITENFRTPDAHIGFDLFETFTRGQLLSLPMIIFGIVLIYLSLKRKDETVS
tara:strand:- start:1291 stop:2094 length:804 start_codon:yes stop_codon:yes gene_type:complete